MQRRRRWFSTSAEVHPALKLPGLQARGVPRVRAGYQGSSAAHRSRCRNSPGLLAQLHMFGSGLARQSETTLTDFDPVKGRWATEQGTQYLDVDAAKDAKCLAAEMVDQINVAALASGPNNTAFHESFYAML
jgi:hypothetical protein